MIQTSKKPKLFKLSSSLLKTNARCLLWGGELRVEMCCCDLNCPAAQSRRNLGVDCGALGQGSFLKWFENTQVENIKIDYERLMFAVVSTGRCNT